MAVTKSKSKSTTQVVAKKHRIKFYRVTVPNVTRAQMLKVLRGSFGNQVQILDDEELVDIQETSFYQDTKKRMTPGKYMRVYRERNGWSQAQLGTRLGISQRQHISRLERSERDISRNVAKQLAELFNVSVERFL